MVEEKEEFEMGIPNGVGEQMLAHAYLKNSILNWNMVNSVLKLSENMMSL